MITLLLVFFPLAAALAAYLAGNNRIVIRVCLALSALLHAGLTVCSLQLPREMTSCVWKGQEWIGLDRTGSLFLVITSLLFLFVTVHTLLWLPAEYRAETKPAPRGHFTGLQSEHIFIPCMLAFLATMTLVITSRNFGLLWVAVEATTLVSAPLICFHRSDRSLEAMWKYLLICSVGIGLALFGTMLMAVSAQSLGHIGMNMDVLAAHADEFDLGWFKGAFIFILAGYGSLLNCSFLGIIRFWQIAPEPLKPFCGNLLTTLGILSLVVAAFFIIRQSDFKRMLAYSSVEHMGLAALLWGRGLEDYSLIHLCGHSVIKMTLFLVAGNILLAYGTRSVSAVGGMFGRLPRTATLWTLAILLICGTPPSPLFVTEYLLVRESGFLLGAVVLLLLFAVFAGMSMACLKMCMGTPGEVNPSDARVRDTERLQAVPAVAVALALIGGLVLIFILNQGEL